MYAMSAHRVAGIIVACGLWVSCSYDSPVGVEPPPQPDVVGRGAGTYDADTGEVIFHSLDGSGALLDAGDALAGGYAENCEPATWNAGTLVLSVNARIGNGSTSSTYLAPIELRLTGITETGVVRSVNTDLVNAGCGGNGLSLAVDDSNGNGAFDCIAPDDTTNTADDPGWDYSAGLGADNKLSAGEESGCRFIHFNLVSEASFTFFFELLGVVDDGWPPAPSVAAVTTPTAVATQTVSGRCVTTTAAPDQFSPLASDLPATNVVSLLGGASPVTVNCTRPAPCQTVGGVAYCGTYSVSVPLRTNATTSLEIFQTLDGTDRGGSAYVAIVHDTVGPQVSSTNPASGSVGVPPSGNIVVTFSERVATATITSANVQLRRAVAGAVQAAAITLDGTGTQVLLNPTADLLENTSYEIVANTGVTDLVGNALAAQVVRTFTTGKAGTDTIAPTVTSIQPSNGATGIDRRTSVQVTFSEAITDGASTSPTSPSCVDSASVTCTLLSVDDLSRGKRVPGRRTLSSDGRTITFTVNNAAYDSTGPDPSAGGCVTRPATAELDFDCGTSYRVSVSTAVRDLAGNALVSGSTSQFATSVSADLVAPTVQSFTPSAGATGVAQGVSPQVLFSEAVASSTINTSSITLKEDGLVVVSGTASLSSDGLVATFQPSALLGSGRRYVIFANNTITDLAGNPLQAPTNSDFTIAAAPDTTRPTVTSTSPTNGAGNVVVFTTVTIGFSEPMLSSSITTGSVTLARMKKNGAFETMVTGQVSLSADGRTATFTPAAALTNDRDHVLNVSSAARDLVGNTMAAAFVATFHTAKDDTTPPCVSGVSPASGSTGVSSNASFTVNFSEALLPSSVVAGSFELRNSSGVQLSKSVTLSSDQRVVNVVPAAALPAGNVTLTVLNAIRDYSSQQNALTQQSSVGGCLAPTGPAQPTFTYGVVSGADTTPPLVLGLSPAGGATAVSLGADVIITFSEGIESSSVTASNAFLTDASGNSVALTQTLSSSGTVLTMNPTALLASLTTYTARVAAGGPRDLAGNALVVGASTTFTTTSAAADTTAPQVVSICPADNATSVNRLLVSTCNSSYSGKVVVRFSEPINQDTVVSGNFRLIQMGGQTVDITGPVSLQADGVTVTITPVFSDANGLKNKASFQIRVRADVTDAAGNRLLTTDSCGTASAEHCTNFGT
jgi:hypothetical protein